MLRLMKDVLPRATVFLVVLSLLCGGLYTLVVTGIAQAFPFQANGSIIEVDGKKYGSALLGQQYEDERHLWGRIMLLDTGSFIDGSGRPAMYAWASNKSPAGEELEAMVARRVERLRAAHPEQGEAPIPVDLVTCSGSGLDPHISLAAAEYQLPRLARTTGRPVAELREIIQRYTTGRLLGVFGEPVVNVLQVNLALDGILK